MLIFFVLIQNKSLSHNCSNPNGHAFDLLYAKKSKSVWQCVLNKGFINLKFKQSLLPSLCLPDVRVWSQLLQQISFETAVTRVGNIEWGQL